MLGGRIHKLSVQERLFTDNLWMNCVGSHNAKRYILGIIYTRPKMKKPAGQYRLAWEISGANRSGLRVLQKSNGPLYFKAPRRIVRRDFFRLAIA